MPTRILDWLWSDMEPAERQRVARFFLWLIVILHISWACGVIPGVQGFAFADEVDKKIESSIGPIKAEVREIDRKLSRVEREVIAARIVALEERLFNLRKSQCVAIAADNHEAVEFYSRQMQEIRARYFDATQREYQSPTCAEVGA